MTLTEFVQLPIEWQAQHLCERGQHLLHKQSQLTTVDLYALENFYVEVWYNRQYSSITAVICFNSVSKLEPYLNN